MKLFALIDVLDVVSWCVRERALRQIMRRDVLLPCGLILSFVVLSQYWMMYRQPFVPVRESIAVKITDSVVSAPNVSLSTDLAASDSEIEPPEDELPEDEIPEDEIPKDEPNPSKDEPKNVSDSIPPKDESIPSMPSEESIEPSTALTPTPTVEIDWSFCGLSTDHYGPVARVGEYGEIRTLAKDRLVCGGEKEPQFCTNSNTFGCSTHFSYCTGPIPPPR